MCTTAGVLLHQFQRVVYKIGNLQCGIQNIGSHLIGKIDSMKKGKLMSI